MASSQSQQHLDAISKKIDDAFIFLTRSVVVDGATETSESEFKTCEEFLKHLKEMQKVYLKERSKKPTKFQDKETSISHSIPCHGFIRKSKILPDQKLLDAVLCSKIFQDESEYARNRHKYAGQMVWVEMDLSNKCGNADHDTALICGNKIIYETGRHDIDLVRGEYERHWAFVKDAVRQNLIEAFSVPVPEPSKCVTDLKSSVDMAVSSNAPSEEPQKMATMTEETKKILLDELSSLNVDLRLKQQFEFDMKLFADRDVYYWRDRLDGLRGYSNSAPVGCVQSQESEQLRQKVAELEKLTASLRDEIHAASNLSEKVSKLEEAGSENESRWSSFSEKLSKMQIDASLLAKCKNTNEGTRKNAEKLQKLEEEVSTLQRTVDLNEGRWKALCKKVETMDTLGYDLQEFRNSSEWKQLVKMVEEMNSSINETRSLAQETESLAQETKSLALGNSAGVKGGKKATRRGRH